MKLILLGTSGYHPTEDRHTACIMLPEVGVVLDAGTAMFRVREYLITNTLDIFLSHAHLDHIVGLTYLLGILYGKNIDRITVHGAAEKLEGVREHLFSEALFPVEPFFDFRVLDSDVKLPSGGRLSLFPLTHPGGSLGFRLDWQDRSMAYVTDTTVSADYVEKLRGVDLLVHECYFPDGYEERAAATGHSCVTPVAELARSAGVGRLILVHINPLATEKDLAKLEVAKEIFPSTQLGVDRMEIEF